MKKRWFWITMFKNDFFNLSSERSEQEPFEWSKKPAHPQIPRLFINFQIPWFFHAWNFFNYFPEPVETLTVLKKRLKLFASRKSDGSFQMQAYTRFLHCCCLLGLTSLSTIFQPYHNMSGCDRELNAHFYSAASLKYHAPDTWHDTTPIHIILTLGWPVLALPCKWGAASTIFDDFGMLRTGIEPTTSRSLE